mmetsp:Transcript_9714/g.22451  ORF Transcript_9714/g.22451 Transcript_9714/m.22451 type:complete len:272 (+) Transcript_9714:1077-1892(+)
MPRRLGVRPDARLVAGPQAQLLPCGQAAALRRRAHPRREPERGPGRHRWRDLDRRAHPRPRIPRPARADSGPLQRNQRPPRVQDWGRGVPGARGGARDLRPLRLHGQGARVLDRAARGPDGVHGVHGGGQRLPRRRRRRGGRHGEDAHCLHRPQQGVRLDGHAAVPEAGADVPEAAAALLHGAHLPRLPQELPQPPLRQDRQGQAAHAGGDQGDPVEGADQRAVHRRRGQGRQGRRQGAEPEGGGHRHRRRLLRAGGELAAHDPAPQAALR